MGRLIGYLPGKNSVKDNSDAAAPGSKDSQAKEQKEDQNKRKEGQGEPK